MMFPPAATWTRAVGLRGQGLKQETDVEPINLYLEKLRLHRTNKDKTAPITKLLEKHRQNT